MKTFKKNLITVAFLAALTLSASLFSTSNFAVHTAFAQTAGSTGGGGPQDGSDGKKKRCRPPQQCPTSNPTNNRQGGTETTEPNVANGSESSDWWDDFIDWLFGE